MKTRLLAAVAFTLLSATAASLAGYGASGYIVGVRNFADQNLHVSGPIRSSGSANIDVQVRLARLGYYHGAIDGNVYPGTQTSIAIASYQRDHRLPVTGTLDGGLIASLNGQ